MSAKIASDTSLTIGSRHAHRSRSVFDLGYAEHTGFTGKSSFRTHLSFRFAMMVICEIFAGCLLGTMFVGVVAVIATLCG
jgi:hypothetical protein